MQGPKWPFLLILIVYEPDVVISLLLGQVCTLGRAPCTKETLPDFREWCQVTQHSRVFRKLTDCKRTPRFWGITASLDSIHYYEHFFLFSGLVFLKITIHLIVSNQIPNRSKTKFTIHGNCKFRVLQIPLQHT